MFVSLVFPSAPTAFTYSSENDVGIGDLVAAPLRKRVENGIVIGIAETPPNYPTKAIEGVVRKNLLTEWQVTTALWVAEYYAAHFGKTFRLFVPERIFANRPMKRAVKNEKINAVEQVHKDLNEDQNEALRKILNQLSTSEIPNTKYQILNTFLLHGITGSGKTEVYLRVIQEVLKNNQQAILLVPEIALTPQLVGYFAATIPSEEIAVIHSNLAEGARISAWEKIHAGEIKLVIGSRSALFAPTRNLGVIILDEEHEWTYKNDQTPRYHARSVAQKIAELTGAKLILGSATPSFESYAAARSGRIQLLELPKRIDDVPLPKVSLVDLRDELKKQNYSIFSDALVEKMQQALEKKEQIILLLNKRGYSTALVCRDCGEAVRCRNCDITLTHHKSISDFQFPISSQFSKSEFLNSKQIPNTKYQILNTASRANELTNSRLSSEAGAEGGTHDQLICHLCGHFEPVPKVCPKCKSNLIRFLGTGTQKLESEIQKVFPQARILRADRDTTATRGSHFKIYDAFRKHEADILVGTQIVAKGLDLPNVTLVGVLLADIGLHIPDFRASEKTFSLLTQVAGRAGRKDKLGEVIIQTYTPEHPAIVAARTHDYQKFYAAEIKERKEFGYPPFSHLIKFDFVEHTEKTARKSAETFFENLKSKILNLKSKISVAPALIPRLHNKYHYHVIVRTRDPREILRLVEIPGNCRVDVDPVSVG